MTLQNIQANELLKCLGKEELKIHQKKSTGPIYQLNQTFTNAVAAASEIDIKKKYLDKICKSKQNSTSVSFIKVALLEGIKIYKSNNLVDEKLKAMQLYNIENFNNKIPLVFFKYLSQLQALTTYPHCFNENIPEIPYYLERYKYLQDEYEATRLMNDKAKIKSIFAKLNKLDSILKKCNKKQKELEAKIKT
jgi:hypothetical protein